ncbi:lysophospholipid acyltransferase family protein [Paludibacterium denitrificans]|uniref:lysophospholipid acyltransferase family protein n=1 Tax=Paludibacterium denitrificans TaxID=2675226 RepID=UPI001E5EB987|nr:lysophospholipid acyltransferase family protein [Paludibacterium denitrificans]
MTSTTTPYLVRLTRLCRLGLHLTRGILIVATRYKRLAQPERAVVTRRWSAQLLKILGISLKVNGLNPGFYPPNTLLVANHVSWLDIFVLNSVTVSRFVAKREIRDWPVIGWLVQVGGTLFIDRSNRRDASRVNQQLAEALAKGGCMAVFPEATTSDGRGLLPFKSSLFEAALLAKGTVQPVALRYQLPDGELTTAAAYAKRHHVLAKSEADAGRTGHGSGADLRPATQGKHQWPRQPFSALRAGAPRNQQEPQATTARYA